MHIWDSVNCIPLRIFADGRTANIISVFAWWYLRLVVNFIPDHATKHQHFIVSNFRKTFHLFLEYEELPALPYSRLPLTLKRLGGGGPKMPPPLDISRDYSATRKAFAATLYEFFLSSFPHILTPNLWRPGVRFWSYVTFCTCTSDRKWLQNVILCTKSMQIEFFHIVHINMLIFTLNGWN